MRPDALPVRPLASLAEIPARLVRDLFGTDLSGGERVAVASRGETALHVAVALGAGSGAGSGERARLLLSMADFAAVGPALRLVGPVGSAAAPEPEPLVSTLVLPEGLRRAWTVPARATLGLGPLAVEVHVADGDAAALHVDPTVWLAAGRPETARWLPGVDLSVPLAAERVDDRTEEVESRVVTETAVRQARLRGRKIRLRPEQIVTPGARDLAREWNVFAEPFPVHTDSEG